MLKKQDAIVLKSIDYGETNKIVTLFTKEDGKLAVLAKGAKKPNSRFAAVTQPFVYGSYLYFQGNGLPSLSQGRPSIHLKNYNLISLNRLMRLI